MKRLHQDVYIGIGIIIVSIIFLLLSLDMPEGSSLFPKIILSLFGLFGIAIMVDGIRKGKDSKKSTLEERFRISEAKLPFISLMLIIGYVLFIDLLGFFVSTTIFIIVFMFFYKLRNLKTMLITVVTLNIFMYFLFVYQLNLPLPQGLLF